MQCIFPGDGMQECLDRGVSSLDLCLLQKLISLLLRKNILRIWLHMLSEIFHDHLIIHLGIPRLLLHIRQLEPGTLHKHDAIVQLNRSIATSRLCQIVAHACVF